MLDNQNLGDAQHSGGEKKIQDLEKALGPKALAPNRTRELTLISGYLSHTDGENDGQVRR